MIEWLLKRLFLESKSPSLVRWAWLWLSVLFAFLVSVPSVFPPDKVILFTEFLNLCLFSAAFNLLMGQGGMVSFGQAAFFAIGAYSAAYATSAMQISMIYAIPMALGISIALSCVLGFFVVRLTSVYFSMLTLSFAQILETLVYKFSTITGGIDGIQGVNPIEFLDDRNKYYYFTLLVVTLCSYFLFRLSRSPFGHALRAVRDNRRRASFVGINIRQVQFIAYVVSAAMCAVSGILLSYQINNVDPSFISFNRSFDPLLATLIGGIGSFAGPFVGSFVLTFVRDMVVQALPLHWPLVMGLILVLLTLFWWAGIVGMLKDPRWRKWLWVPFIWVNHFVNETRWFLRKRFAKKETDDT